MPRITPTVRLILIGLFAVYVAQLLLENFVGVRVFGWLAMTPGALLPWQLVTHVLVENRDPFWFLFGLLFTGWALSRFEEIFGPTRTWQLCLVSALSASVPTWAIGAALGNTTMLCGAWPLWLTAMAATCWLDRRQMMSLFGAVTMTAQQLLYLLIGFAVLNFLFARDVVALISQLGAIGGGILFIQYMRRPRTPKKPPPRKPSRGGFKVIQGGSDEKRLLH